MFWEKGQLIKPTPTPAISHLRWLKISGLEIDIFDIKLVVKSGLDFFIFKFYELL